MNDDLWGRVRGLESKTWKGCECVELLVLRPSKIDHFYET